MQPRILLAGIAKNEGAYLPEWIYHHLSIGVAGVMVYVNNTSDNSVAVLDKIQTKHPVNYRVVDGIEKSEDDLIKQRLTERFINYYPLQSKSYADIYNKTDPREYDYILFLDIDEFLLLDKKLSTLYSEGLFNSPIINFRWFCATGDNAPFRLLSECTKGEYDQFCKCMVKTGLADIKISSPHAAISEKHESNYYNKALVLHRVLRSKEEYLALIARSDPTRKNLSNVLKLNRRGWTKKFSERLPKKYAYIFDNYEQNFEGFCQKTELTEALNDAQDMVLDRAKNVRDQVTLVRQQNMAFGRVLGGTGIHHFKFFPLLKEEIKNKLISLFFPSLIIKHVPFFNHLKYKLKLTKKDKFMD